LPEDIDRVEELIDRERMKEKDSDLLKIIDGVFDKSTLMALYDLVNHGVFEVLQGVISTGKEAHVFRALDKNGDYLAVKIFRTATTDFRDSIWKYIDGDPRFTNIRKNKWYLMKLWAKKEYKNLRRAYDSGIRVPEPIRVSGNVLVMEFIGDNGNPAPLMKDSPPEDPEETFHLLIRYLRKLYWDAELVHGDISEYNVMMWDNPVLIDFSQGVLKRHPASAPLLRRDIQNLVRYFSKLGVETGDPMDIFSDIVEEGD